MCASEDGLDALNRFCRADIDLENTSMRHVAALEGEMLHSHQRDIIDIGGAALNQARIFPALDALADELRQTGESPSGQLRLAAVWIALTMCW